MSCKLFLISVFSMLSVVLSPLSAQTVIYVDDDASLGGDGQSWQTAYRFLQNGLAAAQDGDEVRVGQGLYKPDCNEMNPGGTGDREASFALNGHMRLRGGFAGLGMPEPNEQDPNQYPTILSGDLLGNDVDVNDLSTLKNEPTRADNALHVMVVSGWQPPSEGVFTQESIWSHANLIEGVKIVEGHAPGSIYSEDLICGGGILLIEGYSIIKACQLEGNYAQYGGGVYLYDSCKANILACRFFRNVAEYGGGIYCEGDSLKRSPELELTDCKLNENCAASGGGAYAAYSKVTFIRCTLTANVTSNDGGAIYSYSSQVEMVNSKLRANIAGNKGGGIACSSGTNYIVSVAERKIRYRDISNGHKVCPL